MDARHNLFQSQQLPPPSRLHLNSNSTSSSSSAFARSNTLPPIANISHSGNSNSNSHPHNRSSYQYQTPVHPPSANNQLPPLPPTTVPAWSHHRTSSSRDEIHPSQRHHHQQHHPQQQPLQQQHPTQHHRSDSSRKDPPLVKREAIPPPQMQHHDHQQAQVSGSSTVKEPEDGMPATSDFVKKLFKMLEDPSFSHTVCWAPGGDSFVVKDMNEFTKSILPRMFKHSNFASFVRQLNKYDFHKVKNTDDNQFGEHSWTFRHPDFHAERRDALENIKRKVPTQRKSISSTTPTTTSNPANQQQQRTNSSSSPAPTQQSTTQLQAQIDGLTRMQEEMTTHMRNLERNYQEVLNEMVNFQRNMAQQDGLVQNLIQYFLQVENSKIKQDAIGNSTSTTATGTSSNTQVSSTTSPTTATTTTTLTTSAVHAPKASSTMPMTTGPLTNPFLPTQEAQRMMGGSYPESDIGRASLVQMNEISRRAEVAGMSFALSGNSNGAEDPRGGDRPNSALRMMANAAGLMVPDVQDQKDNANESGGDGMPVVTSRRDALARIEEIHRSRPSSSQGIRDPTFGVNGTYDLPFGGETWTGGGGVNVQDSNGSTGGGEVVGTGGDEAGDGTHQGLQVFTMGHLMPRSVHDDGNGNWSFDPGSLDAMLPALTGADVSYNSTVPVPTSAPTPAPRAVAAAPEPVQTKPLSSVTRPATSQKLRVRRSTFVPGWAVPPRVLLVDDDEVNRRMSSKFLQVFGCTIDVAVDGVGAVERMNLEKYDLVLMDIVMPKLDGISATSMIRQFDHMTPIISMTSNSKPNEILTYYSSGMNDILPKPFTQDGLLEMLEKHLRHLKVIQQMAQIPRSVGIPPLSDSSFEQALAVGASNNSLMAAGGSDEIDGRINPLAGMGLTDEQYTMILQNLVNGESFPGVQLPSESSELVGSSGNTSKRGLEDDEDGRSGKRGRFEVLE